MEDLKDSPDAPARTVTCAWCGNRYRSAVPGDLDRGRQGSHCASDVVRVGEQWIVRGGYGSDEHDLRRYVFVAHPPSAPTDPVCDECVSERILAGDLRQDPPEVDRAGRVDFGPRPPATWLLVGEIRHLIEESAAMRRVVTAAEADHDAGRYDGADTDVHAAVLDWRKHQRYTGEIDDDGETYTTGEVADHLREAARDLERLAASVERRAVAAVADRGGDA